MDETLNRLTSLFITYFNEQITSLLNTLLNTTVINLANQKINEFLYSKTCPGVADPDYVEINTNYTSFAVGAAFSLFAILIFFCAKEFKFLMPRLDYDFLRQKYHFETSNDDIDIDTEEGSGSGKGAKGSLRDRLISILFRERYEKFRLQREFYTKDNIDNKIKYIKTIKDFDIDKTLLPVI